MNQVAEYTSQEAKSAVILFRTATGVNDPYEVALRSAGYHAKSIKVLFEEYDVRELEEIIRAGPGGWGNIVISSKRGAEGWIRAATLSMERGEPTVPTRELY
jgi:hypothetical protein